MDLKNLEFLSIPSVPFDELLFDKKRRFLRLAVDEMPIPPWWQKIATLTVVENPVFCKCQEHLDYMHVKWHLFTGRNKVKFTHNLEHLWQHPDGVTTIPCVAFGFLECIRAGLDCRHPIIDVVDDEEGIVDVYMGTKYFQTSK